MKIFSQFFNKHNLIKIIFIFSIGFIVRFFINNFNINIDTVFIYIIYINYLSNLPSFSRILKIDFSLFTLKNLKFFFKSFFYKHDLETMSNYTNNIPNINEFDVNKTTFNTNSHKNTRYINNLQGYQYEPRFIKRKEWFEDFSNRYYNYICYNNIDYMTFELLKAKFLKEIYSGKTIYEALDIFGPNIKEGFLMYLKSKENSLNVSKEFNNIIINSLIKK